MRLTFRIVAVAALAAAFGQVTLGGVVRVTGSGLGCPDWPLCHGRIIPPVELATFIEYSHRLSASALGLLILAVAALAWLFYRSNYWVLVPSALGAALMIVAAALGGVTVLTELAWWVRLMHLGMAEALVACIAVAVVAAWRVRSRLPHEEQTLVEADRFKLLVIATVLGAFALILSGSYMVGYGAGSSCGTWPLCRGNLAPDGTQYLIHMGHRYLAALVGFFVIATAVSAWSRRARRPELGWAALLLAVLFVAQVIVGAGTVWAGFSSQMKAVHLSLATLVWVTLVLIAALVLSYQQLGFPRVVSVRWRVSEPKRLMS